MVSDFTKEDDERLVEYLAVNCPVQEDRGHKVLYKQLVQNPDQWPWSVCHTWVSWMARYATHRERFDHRVQAYLKANGATQPPSPPPTNTTRGRTKFTPKEDKQLLTFLAKVSSKKQGAKYGRSGNAIYKDVLVDNPDKYPWAQTHPWQSWRDRYVKRSQHFDERIARWQMRHGFDPDVSAKHSEVSKKTPENDEKSPDVKPGQTEAQLCALDAEHGTKRRRYDDERVKADTDPDGAPPPKRQKASRCHTNPGVEMEEPAETLEQNRSVSSVVDDTREGRARDPSQSIASTDHQGLVTCEVEEDKECDGKSMRSDKQGHANIDVYDEGLHSPLPALPQTNDPPENIHTLHTRAPPNTPICHQQCNKPQVSPPQTNNTSDGIHQSNLTSKALQVSNGPSHTQQVEDMNPSEPPLSPPSHEAEDPSTSKTHSVSPPPGLHLARTGIDHLDPSEVTSEVPEMSRRSMSVSRSHHPTPPSTNVQSEASTQSPSTESDSPTLAVQADEKNSPAPSVLPVCTKLVAVPRGSPLSSAATSLEQPGQTRLSSAQPSLFASTSSPDPFIDFPSPQHIAGRWKPVAYAPPRRLPGGAPRGILRRKEDSEDESCSDGPFATSPPSPPRRIEVIRGLPKPRSGKSFRDTNWVRERRVVSGTSNQKDLGHDATNHKKDEDKHVTNHKRMKTLVEANKSNQPQLMKNNVSTDGSTQSDTTYQCSNRSATFGISRLVSSGQPNGIATGPTPIPNKSSYPIRGLGVEDISGDIPNRDNNFKEDRMPMEAQVIDVFKRRTPIASGSNRDPYVLNTAHLPESSTSSPVLRAELDSPVSRFKVSHNNARRRTFAGFGSRSSLPNIDLVDKLGKRASSRVPARFRTRRASLDNASNSDSVVSIPRSTLGVPEQRVSHYRPPRPTVIPILIDPASQHTSSAVFNEWSPSTSRLVINAGLSAIFKKMEENHGFSASVVRRAWLQQNMDLDATDALLLRMRVAAENASLVDDHVEQVKQLGGSSNRALEGTQSVPKILSAEYTAPDPGIFSSDYTPPARSRAEQYRHLLECGYVKEIRQHDTDSVGPSSSKSSTGKNKLSQAVWSAEDDDILRTGDEVQLEVLANKFSGDTVRRRFLAIMRESHVLG